MKQANIFTYHQTFGLHLKYQNQVDNNNWSHTPIHLYRKWATNFGPDHIFAWYIFV